jgi:DivIVA domain-containing protein
MSERDPVESVRRLPSREGAEEPKQPEHAAQEPTPPQTPAARPEPKAPPKRRARPAARRRSGVDEVRDVSFPIAFRGYDRIKVDAYVAKVSQLVAELEATQLREGVVQRALDEVGEETSSILQRAHETAEEIASRSRSQAEGRLQRAEREAADVREQADRYAKDVQSDTTRLREERAQLIEEIRQFADEVLRVADEAVDRLPEPAPSDAAEGDAPEVADDATHELRPPGDAEQES